MSDFDVKEKRFEQDIEEYLIIQGGYVKGNPQSFDRKLGLDTNTFVSFIKNSQPKKWERYEKIYGADSEKQIVERFCREVKMNNLLHVFRKGLQTEVSLLTPYFGNPKHQSIILLRNNMKLISCIAQGSYIIQF